MPIPRYSFRWILPLLLILAALRPASAQVFPFTSGPIPMCDTTTFTANVSGMGYLVVPGGWDYGYYLETFLMNITTDHPGSLQISLTSPAGTTLMLSAFNGAGGQNYTNTEFNYWTWASITTGSAPFTGQFQPQGGTFDVFAGQLADGPWVITVVDTACAGTDPNTGTGLTPGWFDGGVGSGAFGFGYASGGTNTCTVDMGTQVGYLCGPGETVNIMDYFQSAWGDPDGVMLSCYSAAPPYDVSSPGEYYIEGEGTTSWGDQCYYYGTFFVVQGAAAALGPDQVIDQCASTATAVSLPYLFTWLNSTLTWTLDGQPFTQANNATQAGLYQVIATPNSQCGSDTAYVTFNIHPDPELGVDELVSICPGGIADLSAVYDLTGLTATWSFAGAPVSDPTAVATEGIYTLVATAPGGCSDTANITLTMAGAAPALGADQAVSVCDNSELDLTGLFDTAGFISTWTLDGAAVPDPTAVSTAGNYQLVVTTASACSDTALVVVSLNSAPELGANASAAICSGATADLTGLYETTGLSAAWTLDGAPVTTPDAVSAAGLYTLVATNANACSDSATVLVTLSPSPELGLDQSLTRCAGETVNLVALYPAGSAIATWTLNGATISDPTSVSVSGSYTVVVTTAAGCSDTAAVDLLFNVTPDLGNDQSATICAGDSFDLSTLYNTAGLTASWTLGAVAVSDPSAVSASGNYQLQVTNSLNCSDMAIVILTVNTPPSLGPDQVFSICSWQSVDLSAVFPVTGTSVTYTLNGQSVADPTNVTEAGSYMITSADASGCSDEAMATVIPIECLCEADFIDDAHCQQEAVQFTLVADSTVVAAHWDFHGMASNANGESPAVSFFEAGQMLVTLHATLSCGMVTVERLVSVPDCSDACNMFIPTAFTPDGDGVNDGWIWQGECIPEDYSMIVFDRWGEQVFSSKDPLKAWDGMVNGKELPSGVYPYRVNYRLLYQEPKEDVGAITLVR